MDVNEKISLVKEVGQEIVTEEELSALFSEKKHPIAYDGFEPSGKSIHIAQGLLRAININKLTKTGIKFKMLVADWHAWANNKLNGDLDLIQTAGKYYLDVWKACGLDDKNVEFVWANDLMNDPEYHKIVMQVARNNTVKRIIRCSQIMGRSESETLQASQIFYPCMQAADIFYLKADITQLGMDQRKVNVLAREVGPKLGFWKPIIVSHHMLMGLGQPPATNDAVARATAMKMSKSNPDMAFFMDDSEDEIKRKMKKAYCPEGIIEENPILELSKYILFEHVKEFKIERPEKFGGNVSYNSYDKLANDFSAKKVHPMDLKQAAGNHLNDILEPIRKQIEKSKHRQALSEALTKKK